jgi:beta-galactosidase/beta-glucuronidase
MIQQKLSLDGQWEFFPDPERHLTSATLEDDRSPYQITVPGPWQAQFAELRDYSGVAWYRRSFHTRDLGLAIGDHPPQSAVYIHFGAVDYHATVWLNGQLVGEHEGSYLPFEFQLDGMLQPDALNELVVRVIDPDDDATLFPEFPFAEIPHGKQSWYGPISGIWQSVTIELRHPTHIRRLQITPDVLRERAQVTVHLNCPAPQPYALLLDLIDPNGQSTQHLFKVAGDQQYLEAIVPVLDPLLWDTLTPHLYRLEASLCEIIPAERINLPDAPGPVARPQYVPLDMVSSTFGMRTIATTANGYLLLNDRILYLRGALDQDYYPHMIYTPFSDAELDAQFAQAKHMGLNCLRTHIKTTDPRYYDAADRAGLLIWTELPNWERLTLAAQRRARNTITGMIERDWNHPSIIIWTIINEGWGVDLAVNSEHRAWLAEIYAYLKELDPHRLVVGNSPCFGNFHVVTDIEDFHNYYAIPDHYRKWRIARLEAVTAAFSEALTLTQVARVVVCKGVRTAGAAAGVLGLLTADGTEFEQLT